MAYSREWLNSFKAARQPTPLARPNKPKTFSHSAECENVYKVEIIRFSNQNIRAKFSGLFAP